MAEDKPFEPTPSKIRQARREGNVARSQELTIVVVFAACAAATLAVIPWLGAVLEQWFTRAPSVSLDPLSCWPFATLVLTLSAIPLLAAAGGALTMNLVQTGGPLIVSPKFKLEHLKIDEGLKRMFSAEAAISATRASVAFVVAGAAFAPIVTGVFTRATAQTSVAVFDRLAIDGATRIVGSAIAVAAAFAVIDVILARKRWRKKLRMDAYEFKRDMKENDGNPQLKSRRRAIHRSLQRGAARNVKQAAIIVTNPTHIAVALAYDPPAIAVPLVLVLAADGVAVRVKGLARRYGIAIVEDVALARLLFATATVGTPIPRETFVAVAELVVALRRTVPSL